LAEAIMSSGAEVERLTHDYGREVFARLSRTGPLPFGPGWWDERLMEWTMSNEALKVHLFRFVDVLPTLCSPGEVSRHLREYFAEAEAHLNGLMRLGLHLLPNDGFLGDLVARTARLSTERLARRFIAGSNIPEALNAIARLRRRSLAFTIDLLGEATITEAEAEQYLAEYLALTEGLGQEVNSWEPIDQIDRDDRGPLPRVNVSVKLSSLFSQFDPIDPVGTSRAVRARLRPIVRAARQRQAFVNIDMEQYSYKDLTLRIFREVLDEDEFRDWPDAGIAIQVYLRDTAADLEELARWAERRGTPVWVRLIKGAYWDYEVILAEQQGWSVPVFTEKWETDANYERLTRFLLENRHLQPGARHGPGRRDGPARALLRNPDALRHGRPPPGRPGVAGPAGARLHALRRAAAGHGLPGPPAAGEHAQRVLLAGQLGRSGARGAVADEPFEQSAERGTGNAERRTDRQRRAPRPALPVWQ
jgi:RHH-type proline utilization regulon transcriptional repressor/proline dehydrogenase/delta 1-pyrroline-5-carboxylate dehydrogenase